MAAATARHGLCLPSVSLTMIGRQVCSGGQMADQGGLAGLAGPVDQNHARVGEGLPERRIEVPLEDLNICHVMADLTR